MRTVKNNNNTFKMGISSYMECIPIIKSTKEKLILEAFNRFGFDKEYLIEHRDEFTIGVHPHNNREYFYHKGELLFCYFMEFGDCGVIQSIEFLFANKIDGE